MSTPYSDENQEVQHKNNFSAASATGTDGSGPRTEEATGNLESRFAELFVGSEESHGVQTHKEGQITHHTEDGRALPEHYHAHLSGVRGLGLVPVRKGSLCRFAAIDLDVDTINHQQLFEKVQKHRMPLYVCRSKSGGAHLYVFMKGEGGKAGLVIATLRRWAGILGYPSSEIFPKQAAVNKMNRGNWINLPYFGGDSSNRYGVGADGAQTLRQFLDSITYWDGKDRVVTDGKEATNGRATMPPCLASLTRDGLPEGYRNMGLTNFAIFFRKSSPNGWEDKVVQHNQQCVSPPLPYDEVQRIIKSVSKTKYQYLCDQEPICSRCDRQTCLKLEFGVGHMPWKEAGTFDDFNISHLRKINTDPPTYLVEVNGHDLSLTSEQFFDYRKLASRVEELLDMVIPRNMKQERWDQMRKELHATQEEIEAPEDASEEGSILSSVRDFLAQFRNSTDAEDILKGTPIEKGNFVCFKVDDLQRFLKMHRRQWVDNNILFKILKLQGCEHRPTKIKGRVLRVWMFPISRLNLQTEDFTLPKFETAGEDL